jgi:hypothetical protein
MSHVPLIPLHKGLVPIQPGVYEVLGGAKGDAWTLQQTGFQINKVEDHYTTHFRDEAMSVVAAGYGIEGMKEGTSVLLQIASMGENISPLSPQQRFLKGKFGYVMDALNEKYFVLQCPQSFRPEEFPTKQLNGDDTEPAWGLMLMRETDENTWELSLCDKCKEASIAVFGGRQTCDADGKCETTPTIRDFVSDPEKNREILRKAVESFATQPVLKFVRVGS